MPGAAHPEARDAGPPRRGALAPRLAVLAGSAVIGYLYGWVSQLVPGAVDPSTFWIGNLAAPYLALPFLAGAVAGLVRADRISSAVAGSLAAGAAVAGFYELQAVGRPSGPGNPTGGAAFLLWFGNLLLGVPGGMPWLTVALVLGTVLGLLGAAWVRRRQRWWLAVPVAGAFLLEPVVTLTIWRAFLEWRLGTPLTPYSLTPANLVVWATEMVLGASGLVAVWILSRRSRR